MNDYFMPIQVHQHPVKRRCSRGHEWEDSYGPIGQCKPTTITLYKDDKEVGPLCYQCLVERIEEMCGTVETVEDYPKPDAVVTSK